MVKTVSPSPGNLERLDQHVVGISISHPGACICPHDARVSFEQLAERVAIALKACTYQSTIVAWGRGDHDGWGGGLHAPYCDALARTLHGEGNADCMTRVYIDGWMS